MDFGGVWDRLISHLGWLGPVLSVGLGTRIALRTLEEHLSVELRGKIAEYVVSAEAPRGIRDLLELFFSGFSTIYAFRNTERLIVFPNLLRATLISFAIFALAALAFPQVIAPFLSLIDFYNRNFGLQATATFGLSLAALLVLNGMFDAISVTETRAIILFAARRGAPVWLIAGADFVFTLLVSYLFFVAFILSMSYAPNDISSLYLSPQIAAQVRQSPPGTQAILVLGEASRVFISIFTTPFLEWTITDRFRFLFLFTTFSTSAWVWVYTSGLVLVRLTSAIGAVRHFILTYMNFREQPLTFVWYGMFAFGLVLSVPVYFFRTEIINMLAPVERPCAPEVKPISIYIAFFDRDSAALTPAAIELLQYAVAQARRADCGRGYRFRILGNTDTAENSFALSAARANAVRAFFQFNGIDLARIIMVSRGAEDLLVPTPPGTPEPQNRRVVIEILRSDMSPLRRTPAN